MFYEMLTSLVTKFEAAEEVSCDNQTCGMWVVS
jgi:hypothetical protein